MVKGNCDWDIGWRERKVGERNYFVDQSVRIHDFSATLGSVGYIVCLQNHFRIFCDLGQVTSTLCACFLTCSTKGLDYFLIIPPAYT